MSAPALHWTDRAERRAETTVLVIERDDLRRRRGQLQERLRFAPGRRDARTRARLAEMAWITRRLIAIEIDLKSRGMM